MRPGCACCVWVRIRRAMCVCEYPSATETAQRGCQALGGVTDEPQMTAWLRRVIGQDALSVRPPELNANPRCGCDAHARPCPYPTPRRVASRCAPCGVCRTRGRSS
ncbi:hypothetical protein GGS23DRAFT_543286 [Durotheca rogersii]|uniref:uncharacterized protein n=1 Tax=Durotheca rogersii TaxID=419775 RepID=UPI00221FE1E3|nr:uncharacterized protein GGS23DRAFT_543286 [Durotheca rogersii]KAI5867943.1 hypothetical protein GGS23DRAFT_543286 [Durotheca rogersii]